jgi:hypothetical protein
MQSQEHENWLKHKLLSDDTPYQKQQAIQHMHSAKEQCKNMVFNAQKRMFIVEHFLRTE